MLPEQAKELSRLIAEHEKRLLNLARFFYKNGSEQDAEDLYQETLINILGMYGTEKYENIANFYNWAKVIMRNKYLNEFTAKKRRDAYAHNQTYSRNTESTSSSYEGDYNEGEYLEEGNSCSVNNGENNLVAKEIRQCIAKLDRKSQRILTLHLIDDIPIRDIARRQRPKVSYWTVYRKYKAAQIQLQQEIIKLYAKDEKTLPGSTPLFGLQLPELPESQQERKDCGPVLDLFPDYMPDRLHQPHPAVRKAQRKKAKNPYKTRRAKLSQLAIEW